MFESKLVHSSQIEIRYNTRVGGGVELLVLVDLIG
jgi:hypothetical protein